MSENYDGWENEIDIGGSGSKIGKTSRPTRSRSGTKSRRRRARRDDDEDGEGNSTRKYKYINQHK